MPKKLFMLEIVPYEYDDNSDYEGESYVPQPPHELWSKRFRSPEKAVKCAIRTIKRQLCPGVMQDPDFHLYSVTGGVREEVTLPRIYIIAWSSGPKFMAGNKYSVTPR